MEEPPRCNERAETGAPFIERHATSEFAAMTDSEKRPFRQLLQNLRRILIKCNFLHDGNLQCYITLLILAIDVKKPLRAQEWQVVN